MADKLPARLAEHPTVRKVRARASRKPGVLDADWLREICLAAGADDVAFASVDNPALASEVEHVEAALPGTKSYISLVVTNVTQVAAQVTAAGYEIVEPLTEFTALPGIGWFFVADPDGNWVELAGPI